MIEVLAQATEQATGITGCSVSLRLSWSAGVGIVEMKVVDIVGRNPDASELSLFNQLLEWPSLRLSLFGSLFL